MTIYLDRITAVCFRMQVIQTSKLAEKLVYIRVSELILLNSTVLINQCTNTKTDTLFWVMIIIYV